MKTPPNSQPDAQPASVPHRPSAKAKKVQAITKKKKPSSDITNILIANARAKKYRIKLAKGAVEANIAALEKSLKKTMDAKTKRGDRDKPTERRVTAESAYRRSKTAGKNPTNLNAENAVTAETDAEADIQHRREMRSASLESMPYRGMMIERAPNAPIMPDNIETRWGAAAPLIERMSPDWAARIVCYPVRRNGGGAAERKTSYAYIEILNQSPLRKLIVSYRVTRVRGVVVQRRHRLTGRAAWGEKVPSYEGTPHLYRPATFKEWSELPQSVQAVLSCICEVVNVPVPTAAKT